MVMFPFSFIMKFMLPFPFAFTSCVHSDSIFSANFDNVQSNFFASFSNISLVDGVILIPICSVFFSMSIPPVNIVNNLLLTSYDNYVNMINVVSGMTNKSFREVLKCM